MKIKHGMMNNFFSYKNDTKVSNEHIEAGLCKCLAYKSAIPSTKVKLPKAWYAQNVAGEVRSVLSNVNEKYYIDINNYSDRVYEIWRSRYDLTHDVIRVTDDNLTMLTTGSVEKYDVENKRTVNTLFNIFDTYIEA